LQDRGVVVELHHRAPSSPFQALDYRALYHQTDVLAITSETEAGPLPLFEAMACGVPVVSTDVGWATRMITTPLCGNVCPANAAALQVDLVSIGMNRAHYFKHRVSVRDRQPWRLEGWITENIELAERIAA
jgi:glycosyltransferase involved in cell wall biosynthesis